MTTYSIGFTREDLDFQLLATLNNNDDLIEEDIFTTIAQNLRETLQRSLVDTHSHENVRIEVRQDAPDYVTILPTIPF